LLFAACLICFKRSLYAFFASGGGKFIPAQKFDAKPM
jgi:hypothetical protein